VFGRKIPHGQSVLKDTKTRLCSIPVSAVGDGAVRVRALSESMEPNEVILTAVKRRPETSYPKVRGCCQRRITPWFADVAGYECPTLALGCQSGDLRRCGARLFLAFPHAKSRIFLERSMHPAFQRSGIDVEERRCRPIHCIFLVVLRSLRISQTCALCACVVSRHFYRWVGRSATAS
jgi:hypothetical protein